MAWSEQMVFEFQEKNNKMLREINNTLRPPSGTKTGKIGIFCPGQAGDLATVTGILKYMDIVFPNKELIWFCNFPNADLLRFSPVSEIRAWLWAGNGLPVGCPDFYPLLCDSNNRLNKELASQYESTKDLEDGIFPTTWMVAPDKQNGIDYPNVSKKIFGIPDNWEWHPFLTWSNEEKEMIKEFVSKFPANRRNILLETFAGSGQSPYWDEELTKKIGRVCREKLGDVNFIFASHKHKGGKDNCGIDNEIFFDDVGCFSAARFTVRQCALLNDYCDLMICMSSGISVSTSAWGLAPIKKLQYCGSKKCSTVAIANGTIELIEMDYKTKEVADTEFFNKLNEMLNSL